MSFSKNIEEEFQAELSSSAIEKEIVLIRKELFTLRTQKGTRQNFKAHRFKHLHHRLSQFMLLKGNLKNN